MSNLDQALGDIIKQNQAKNKAKAPSNKAGRGRGGRGAGRGRGRGGRGGAQQRPQSAGPMRRQRQQRPAPYQTVPQQVGGGLAANNKIMISNLDSIVTEEDVNDIFVNVGPVTDTVVHYNRDGQSLGTAEVTFRVKAHALKAVEEYDGAEVDGRPMHVRCIAVPKPTVVKQQRPQPAFQPVYYQQPPKGARGRGGARGGARGRGRGGPALRGAARGRGAAKGRGGRGGGRGAGKQKPATAEDLDKDMDSYFSKSSDKAEVAAATPSAPKKAAFLGQPVAAAAAPAAEV